MNFSAGDSTGERPGVSGDATDESVGSGDGPSLAGPDSSAVGGSSGAGSSGSPAVGTDGRRGTAGTGRRPAVTMVATPGDGSCGIGTYARDLVAAYDASEGVRLLIDQDDRSALQFLSLALRAARAEGEVVHVQHEYGLFRRAGSRYPGVMGLVFFPALALFARLADKRLVVTMHSVLRPEAGEAAFPVRLYLLVTHQLLATLADHLVFLAAECEESFLADVALDDDEYSRLPHGVNVADAADVTTAEAKARFGLDPDRPVVLIPGFVRPPKGHDLFVDVARALPEYQFFVAGGARPKGEDFAFAARIRREAPENVTVSGVLDDDAFAVALNAADLAFLPYRVVSQSGTFNWCAAQQLPVLASDEPYFLRQAREWDNVETVDVEDRERTVERVRDLLSSPDRRRQLRENMRRYRAANDFRRVAREHERIYEHVLAGESSDWPGVRQARPGGDEAARPGEAEPAEDWLRPACSAQRSGAD